MTPSEKDEASQFPGKEDPSGSPSPSFGAAAPRSSRGADRPAGPFAGGSRAKEEGAGDGAANDAAKSGAGDAGASVAQADAAAIDEAIADAVAAVSDPAQLLAEAQAQAQEWQDKFMRLHAEWDTYRRRTAEQRTAERASATESLVEHLLPVIDDFERTIDYAEKNGERGLLGGVQAVHTKLIDALSKEGVEILDPKGEAFHALECQAVSTCEDTSVPEETVAEVFQKGYKMGRKVLRPAMVTVTMGGPKREAPSEPTD
ncbi:MAG: nucleotide exchange factor GrpE [Eggerthellaceae bacterium]|nr:nucleotide exchange factor GrpE [Eggerthellaceae bacterium]